MITAVSKAIYFQNAIDIFIFVLSVLGIVGNSLVLYVHVRKINKLSSTVFIIALAATDLVTSAVSMPYTIIMEALDYKIPWDVTCKLYYFVMTSTIPFSVFIMVAIAIDRYLCICLPHSHILNSARAKNSILLTLIFAICMGVVPALCYGIYVDNETLIKQSIPKQHQMPPSVGNLTNNFNLYNSCIYLQNDSEYDCPVRIHLAHFMIELLKKSVYPKGGLSLYPHR